MIVQSMRLAILFAAVLLFSACSANAPEQTPKQVTLSVATNAPPDIFLQRYPQPLQTKDYEILIEPLQIPFEHDVPAIDTLIAFIEENQPDLIETSDRHLQRLLDLELLAPLDAYAALEPGYLQDTPLSLLQHLEIVTQQQGLFAIPVEFSSDVIYYNKTILDRHGLPYPHNNMTWAELYDLELALLAAGDDDLLGMLDVHNRDSAALKLWITINEHARGEGVHFMSDDGTSAAVDNEAWVSSASTVLDAYSRYLALADAGKLSKAPIDKKLGFHDGVYPLIKHSEQLLRDGTTLTDLAFDWGMAAVPGTYNPYFQSTVYAINTDSDKQQEAAAFILEAASEAMVKHRLQLTNMGQFFTLPAKISALEEEKGIDYSPFYSKPPSPEGVYAGTSKPIPDTAVDAFWREGPKQIDHVLKGSLTVKEALLALQHIMEQDS